MMIEAFIPVLVLTAAVLLDRVAGEPPARWHPLVGFGALACAIERALRRRAPGGPSGLRILGVIGVIVLIVPASLLAYALSSIPIAGLAFDVVVVYLAIAPRSLEEHAFAVADALRQGDLGKAREAVARIVSRDTGAMSTDDVARASVESVLENGNDAVFGAVFWFIVLGAPGVLMYRLANTLDAMWGYKNETYLQFGWAAARLDDVLNLVPARLTALTYALLGSTVAGLRCWRLQGPTWYSPNAGPVMAAGAGALEVRLGGPASYGGRIKERPVLGCGATPGVRDIERAISLMRRGLAGWMVILGVLCFIRATL
jgi:adenosylcobinamide-phosphate synthase